MHFDGLDFSFADIDLLRDLYRGVGDVLVDKGDETSSLLVLSVGAVRRVVCQGWRSMVLLQFGLLHCYDICFMGGCQEF